MSTCLLFATFGLFSGLAAVALHKMPVTGLPVALETALVSLLDANKLSTWKITGGESHVAVTLRFNMADKQTMTGESEPVHFKKMAPSQVRRNYQRRYQWISAKNNSMSGQNSISGNIHMEDTICSGNAINRHEQDLDHGSGSSIFGGMSETTKTAQTQMSHMSDQDTVIDPCDQNITIPKQTEPESLSDSEDSDHGDSSETSDDTLPVRTDGECDLCSKPFPISQPIWTCTKCDSFAICTPCRRSSRYMTHHHPCESDQLHEYTVPGLVKNDCNCDSCGTFISHHKSKVYECSICDNFILCPRCHQEGMHKYHLANMIGKTKQEYKSS